MSTAGNDSGGRVSNPKTHRTDRARRVRLQAYRAVRTPAFAAVCFILAAVTGGCNGIGIAAPEATVNLRVEGSVRDAVSGVPLADAKVAVVRLGYGWTELASVRTDAQGRYLLTYRLRHVATDREFRDGCTIWYKSTSTSVGIMSEAPGYLWGSDGSDGAPRLRCINELQNIDLVMIRLP
jgi:hypothetical protein